MVMYCHGIGKETIRIDYAERGWNEALSLSLDFGGGFRFWGRKLAGPLHPHAGNNARL